jgi:hypothetical protein
MPARTRTFASVALVALSAVACGGDVSTEAGTSSAAPAPTSEAPASPGSVDPAPVVAQVLDFEAPLLDGGTFRGETLAGRDVAFWFWAPW